MNSRLYGRTLSVAWIASLALFATGCSDSNNNGYSNNNGCSNSITTSNTSNIAVQTGRYTGTNDITGQRGTLDMTVGTGGAITGTYTIAAPTAVARTVSVIPAGIYPVTGSISVSTNNGNYTVTGNIPGLGNFSLTGTIPSGTAQGTESITIDGSTYPGSIDAFSTIVTPGGDNVKIVMHGGVLSYFQFTAGTGYNGVNPPVTTASLIGGTVITNSVANNSVGLVLEEVTALGTTSANIRALALVVSTHGHALVVGQSYPLIASATADGSTVALTETTGSHIDKIWAQTSGTTGSATVTSLTSTTVEMDFQFTNVGASTGNTTSTAAGTFTTSGHILGRF